MPSHTAAPTDPQRLNVVARAPTSAAGRPIAALGAVLNGALELSRLTAAKLAVLLLCLAGLLSRIVRHGFDTATYAMVENGAMDDARDGSDSAIRDGLPWGGASWRGM